MILEILIIFLILMLIIVLKYKLSNETYGIMKEKLKRKKEGVYYKDKLYTGKAYKNKGNDKSKKEISEYKDGILIKEMIYIKEKIEGIVKYYYESGELKIEESWKNNQKNGIAKKYNRDGKVILEIEYKDGKETGIYREYYSNGQLKKKGEYKNGNGVGNFITYYENGQLSSCYSCKEGCYSGSCEEYYENGQLKRRANYEAGDIVGKSQMFYEDGQLKFDANYIIKESDTNTKESILMGKKLEYYPSGKLKVEGDYNNESYIEKEYYESGALKREAGSKLEKDKVYYESGNLQEETFYVEFEDKVITKKYYETGKLKEVEEVIGAEVTIFCYDESGNLLEKEIYYLDEDYQKRGIRYRYYSQFVVKEKETYEEKIKIIKDEIIIEEKGVLEIYSETRELIKKDNYVRNKVEVFEEGYEYMVDILADFNLEEE